MASQVYAANFKEQNVKSGHMNGTVTILSGQGVANKSVLLQDVNFIEKMSHFDRERIPERVVHAKGAAAFGYFEVTKPDIAKHCKASVFEEVGKRTPVTVRFSTCAGESGSADTVRDPRGFAIKMFTDDGVWDLVGNNTPIFFIRDPNLFPSFVHSHKRNPKTHLKDYNAFWDFATLNPETTHQLCFLFSDRGIPDGYRFQHGYGSHTFKLVNKDNEPVYCKFHIRAEQIKNLDVETARKLAAEDPDYATRDLYNAIESNNYPKWSFYVQIMSYEEAAKFKFNPFDLTKVWPQKQFPLIEVGKLVLDRNPDNYFAQVEQLAFSPSNFVTGIEASPDKMLQGRLFAYDDTHPHRLGANFAQLPVNAPKCPVMHANSFGDVRCQYKQKDQNVHLAGDVNRLDNDNDDHFEQVTDFWNNVLTPDHRDRLVANIADHLQHADLCLQKRAVKQFASVHADFGSKLQKALNHAK